MGDRVSPRTPDSVRPLDIEYTDRYFVVKGNDQVQAACFSTIEKLSDDSFIRAFQEFWFAFVQFFGGEQGIDISKVTMLKQNGQDKVAYYKINFDQFMNQYLLSDSSTKALFEIGQNNNSGEVHITINPQYSPEYQLKRINTRIEGINKELKKLGSSETIAPLEFPKDIFDQISNPEFRTLFQETLNAIETKLTRGKYKADVKNAFCNYFEIKSHPDIAEARKKYEKAQTEFGKNPSTENLRKFSIAAKESDAVIRGIPKFDEALKRFVSLTKSEDEIDKLFDTLHTLSDLPQMQLQFSKLQDQMELLRSIVECDKTVTTLQFESDIIDRAPPRYWENKIAKNLEEKHRLLEELSTLIYDLPTAKTDLELMSNPEALKTEGRALVERLEEIEQLIPSQLDEFAELQFSELQEEQEELNETIERLKSALLNPVVRSDLHSQYFNKVRKLEAQIASIREKKDEIDSNLEYYSEKLDSASENLNVMSADEFQKLTQENSHILESLKNAEKEEREMEQNEVQELKKLIEEIKGFEKNNKDLFAPIIDGIKRIVQNQQDKLNELAFKQTEQA
ncbi:MAG: hypothetical protein KR126chlam6_01327 [Candidatus Anoxychlamydiales bacterium]|nr:hypothetical protein [Candidatus Anoxychlamydiales bacterium]